jgi:hypothetical protein
MRHLGGDSKKKINYIITGDMNTIVGCGNKSKELGKFGEEICEQFNLN